MTAYAMLSRTENVITQLATIIQKCRQAKIQSQSTTNASGDALSQLTNATENFHDIETSLCEYMSSLLMSPISGRIFLPHPIQYIDNTTRVASLETQLHIDHD